MPKLSDTMTEGTLVKWNKQVGDTIEIGDVIAEVETDKATMEMEAFDEGVLHEILVQEGDKAAVGATPVSYTHLTLPTTIGWCRSRGGGGG